MFFSGVIQAAAQAHGQIARAWHVTMVTDAHVVTRVEMVSAPPHPSLATHFVNIAMATAAG